MCTVSGSPRVFLLRTVWATEPQPNSWRGRRRAAAIITSEQFLQPNKPTEKSTHNQDKGAQEFRQELLDYCVFECAVVPHAATSGAAGRRLFLKTLTSGSCCDAAEVQSPLITSAPPPGMEGGRGNRQPFSGRH